MKPTLILFILIFSLLACTPDTTILGFGGGTPTPEATPTPLPTPVTVYQATISADGEVVLPIPPQLFSFQSAGLSGVIEEIYVIPGQTVNKGDALAKVDDTDLKTAVDKAQAALAVIQAQIANDEAPAMAGDITEAQANVSAAIADLRRLEALPSAEKITQAAADLRLREIDLRRAQEAYDTVAYADGVGMSPQAAELQQATLNYERAQAIYNEATQPADEADLVKARANIVQAQNQLNKLQNGVRSELKAVNRARLDEAKLQVAEAQANLTKALLLAPWAGLVTEVNAAAGVSIANASITLAKVAPLRFATSNFSERNLSDIKVGDEATLYLKTHPSVPFPAVIQLIE